MMRDIMLIILFLVAIGLITLLSEQCNAGGICFEEDDMRGFPGGDHHHPHLPN